MEYKQLDVRVRNRDWHPPVKFRAFLDLNQRDMFFLSANCTQFFCRDSRSLYNSTRSSTYIPDLTPAEINYGAVIAWGNVSTDIARVSNFPVQQSFVEARTLFASPMAFLDRYDGVLGLSRSNVSDENSTLEEPGLLQNLVEQKVLEKNIFSIMLPKSEHSVGELMVGDVNKNLSTGEFITLPIEEEPFEDPRAREYSAGGWKTRIHRLSLGPTDGKPILDIYLAGYTAIFSANWPGITLPVPMADALNGHLNISRFGDRTYIDCDKVGLLPNLTIAFDDEQEIVLGPQDYMYETEELFGADGIVCALPFTVLAFGPDIPNFIALGNPFLLGVYSVFDFGQKTISYKSRTFLNGTLLIATQKLPMPNANHLNALKTDVEVGARGTSCAVERYLGYQARIDGLQLQPYYQGSKVVSVAAETA
jgi:hypothetical protein